MTIMVTGLVLSSLLLLAILAQMLRVRQRWSSNRLSRDAASRPDAVRSTERFQDVVSGKTWFQDVGNKAGSLTALA